MSKNVIITGTTSGIGQETARYFLEKGCRVAGLDIGPATIASPNYHHFHCDVRNAEEFPDLEDVDILVVNAGVQASGHDIDVNLKGAMNTVEKYIADVKQSICMVASVSAHNGAEFPEYSASKGGLLAYSKNVARRVAEQGVTCNSISPGGVITDLNRPVMDDKEKWSRIMELTPLRKWATTAEIAEWIYFLTAINKSMTGQDVIVDNGEMNNATFVW